MESKTQRQATLSKRTGVKWHHAEATIHGLEDNNPTGSVPPSGSPKTSHPEHQQSTSNEKSVAAIVAVDLGGSDGGIYTVEVDL